MEYKELVEKVADELKEPLRIHSYRDDVATAIRASGD